MLGSVRVANSWKLAAFGKHPALKDYFSLDIGEQLVQGFSEWVKSGFHMAAARKKVSNIICSWRFWMKGPQKDGLACGLVKDSSDRFGRRYPIVIMGSGILMDWEEHWDLLPLACEASWVQMEYLSIRPFSRLEQFEEELQRLQIPIPQWRELAERRGSLKESSMLPGFQGFPPIWEDGERKLTLPIQDSKFFLSLDDGSFPDSAEAVNFWHFLLRRKLKGIPKAIFVGGTSEKIFLGVFKRPLISADFHEMWMVSSMKG